MSELKKSNISIKVLGIYLVIFSLYFLSYPLHYSFIENQDSIYYAALFNYLQNFLLGIISGVDYGQFFYPDSLPALNGEPSFGIFSIWLVLKLIISDNVYTFYTLTVTIFTLNSLAVFSFIRYLNKKASPLVALIAGLVFSFNMFMLANIDNINTVFFAPGIASIYVFLGIILEQKSQKRPLLIFSFLLAFQLFCSIYNFIYVVVFISLFLFLNYKRSVAFIKFINKKYLLSFIPLIVICCCYLYLIVFLPNKPDHWNFNVDLASIKTLSFELKNFTSAIPFSIHGPERKALLLDVKSFFSSYVFIIVILLGLKSFWKSHKVLLIIVLACFLIGVGPYISLNEKEILMPLGYLFNALDTYSYFRMPYRIYLLILLILILIFSYGLSWMEGSFRKSYLILPVIGILIIFENIPLQRHYIYFSIYQKEGEELATLLDQAQVNNVLFLPAGDLINRNGDPTIMNRTIYIFMYWQSYIHKNVINGNSAFNPPHTRELNEALYNSTQPYQSLVMYCKKYKIDCVVQYVDPKWAFDDFNFDQQEIENVLQQNGVAYYLR